jgi:hypothetical protein
MGRKVTFLSFATTPGTPGVTGRAFTAVFFRFTALFF